MIINEIIENKKGYLPLLLLADEQESMIDQYLERGTLYVLDDFGVRCVCVVTDEGNGILEIKNLATVPADQKKGYARAMINYLIHTYADTHRTLQVGTGDSPLTIPFYEKCGFIKTNTIPNFFIEHYDHPIYEAGNQLVDMIVMERWLDSKIGE